MFAITLVLLVVFNLAICWCNCLVCGVCWADSKAIGGWGRFVIWCTAIMTAFGFTMAYSLAVALFFYWAGALPERGLHYVHAIQYLFVIFPIIGLGLVVTIESWRQFIAKPTISGMMISDWNANTQISNAAGAFTGIPDAIRQLSGSGKSTDNSDDVGSYLFRIGVGIVVVAFGAGVLTTRVLIMKYANIRRIAAF